MGEQKDGSTQINAEERERTAQLPDGADSPGRKASEGADTASGGGPDDHKHADVPEPDEVDPTTGTGPDGSPVENPSG